MKALISLALTITICTIARSQRLQVDFIPVNNAPVITSAPLHYEQDPYRWGDEQEGIISMEPNRDPGLTKLPDIIVEYPIRVSDQPASDNIQFCLKPIMNHENQSFYYSVTDFHNSAEIQGDFKIIILLKDVGSTITELGKLNMQLKNGEWFYEGEFLVPLGEHGLETTIEVHHPSQNAPLSFQTVYLYESK